MVCSVLGYITLSAGILQLPENYIDDVPLNNDNSVGNYDEEKLDKIGDFLTKLLIVPWPKNISPLLYVEYIPEQEELLENSQIEESVHPAPLKRTRIYRKYPWKRQNSRYEPGNRFLCTPSREDVYRLLVALHEARQGNRDRVVNFCNRKRPAYAIFTNIRYLGK
ncbi:hypothetical protein NQ314_004734 [Rhamnusium bicolor]|uniref:Uncharacterized protein n=1 Tax=Rhamnusium bicolor TaxID=1586634 RepID=A0AAV8ZKY2_9CUCU|nr:hypothetical protein NQ314_004734 [Rhamnusium bicolor]